MLFRSTSEGNTNPLKPNNNVYEEIVNGINEATQTNNNTRKNNMFKKYNKNNVKEARRRTKNDNEALKYLEQIEIDVKDMVKQGIQENRARIALELKGNKANAINWIKKRNSN